MLTQILPADDTNATLKFCDRFVGAVYDFVGRLILDHTGDEGDVRAREEADVSRSTTDEMH